MGLGVPGPWGPLGLGDPWALGTLGLGVPWALGTLGPWALGAGALGLVYDDWTRVSIRAKQEKRKCHILICI